MSMIKVSLKWQRMKNHMTTNGRSHDNECKITWQWLEDHMTMNVRSHENECKITWQWLEYHMTMTGRAHDNDGVLRETAKPNSQNQVMKFCYIID